LQEEWEKWLQKQKKAAALPAEEAKAAARDLDMSVPNLSSIMLLVEAEGKTVLLTGDGRGDHLLEGLQQSKLLNKEGIFHVDVFKLPHHGSARNIAPELFERITADTYVICANGKYDNPSDARVARAGCSEKTARSAWLPQ
jgi:beta-lactamase superfamily II metal-dependent hydrolase